MHERMVMDCLCKKQSEADIRNRDIEKRLKEDKMNFKSTHRLLLLGLCGADTNMLQSLEQLQLALAAKSKLLD